MSPLLRLAGALGPVLLVVTAGCSSSAPDAPATSEPTTASASASAAPVPTVPRVGECHLLTVAQATDPVDRGKSVPCRSPHTSVTFKVGRLDPVVDGHLLAVDSRTVRTQIAKACPDNPGAFLGGDRTAQLLSRFEVVWFSPSLKQADAGANWYRCDTLALRAAGQLLPLPPRLKGILSKPGALDRYGTCGTKAPDAAGFARVACSQPHRWRAVDVVNLPPRARFLAKSVSATADATCKDIAADLARGQLKRTWSFEWPTRAQWVAGQRYGYCWVPKG